MKRRFKEKHQSSSREDTGSDTRDESSADLTTTRQTSSTDEQSVLGERKSDGPPVGSTQDLSVDFDIWSEIEHYTPPADVNECLYAAAVEFSCLTTLTPPKSAEDEVLPPSQSSPDRREIIHRIKSSFEDITPSSSEFFQMYSEENFEFTPDISAEGDDEIFRLQCSVPRLYQCTQTGLVFDMIAGGDVLYRTVPWNRSLLGQHHKKPAGPLFDITCVQQCVHQLHLPHCEIHSSGGCDLLSVAHVSNGSVEFIKPHTITETHVVIKVSGFSAYGIVKDENSPPDLVRALVLLFYRPPADPHPESFLSVLLQPANVVLRDVQHERRRSHGEELYIPVSPRCKLQPYQFYRLFTNPQDDSVEIQPKKAEFVNEFCGNYLPSFEVILKTTFRSIRLHLKHRRGLVWRRCVYLPSAGGTNSCEKPVQTLTSKKKLLKVRSRFVDAVSAPVLNSLMDKLLEMQVITDAEQEEIEKQQSRRDKARSLIDTVRRKGKTASSLMIKCFHVIDPFLCRHLGLV